MDRDRSWWGRKDTEEHVEAGRESRAVWCPIQLSGSYFLCLVEHPSERFEMQCSGSFPLAMMPRIDFPETPGFNKKVSTANDAGISNQCGPAHRYK